MNTDTQTLQQRMKLYEKANDDRIAPYKPFIARLDGVNFSKFTQGFDKPYDMLFRTIMILTMNDLVEKFQASTGYTQSDEISLIFPAVCTKEEYDMSINKTFHYRKGRKLKLCSIISSYLTARFNYHITNIIELDHYEKPIKTQNRIKDMKVSFDCRLIEYPDNKDYEVLNHQIWRSLDCERNAVLQYGMHVLGNKKIFKMNCAQICDRLDEIKYNYSDPMFILYGTYCKKIAYTTNINDKEVIRSRYINKTFKIKYSDDILKMLFSKYLYNLTELANFKDDNELLLSKYDLVSRSLIYCQEKSMYQEIQ